MIRIIGISGSLRQGSFNTALLRAAAGLMPEDAELAVRTLKDIPLYDGDVEAKAFPASVTELKNLVAGAQGLILGTPEYNNSVPGVLKNAIDWMSRPNTDIKRVFGGRPVALMGASPGPFGTVLAQTAWLPVLRTLGMEPWFGPKLMVSDADEAFDQSGTLTDAKTKERLTAFLNGFVGFIRAARR